MNQAVLQIWGWAINMVDTFKKVRDGEKLKIPARTYNAMVDAAADYINRKNNLTTGSGNTLPANMVYVKNESGVNVDRFCVLGIEGMEITGTNPSFLSSPVIFTGGLPQLPRHSNGRFVVTAEPIKTDAVGRAYISGCVPMIIYMPNAYDDRYNRFAEINNNDPTKMKTSISASSTKVMFLDYFGGRINSTQYWAVIQLGATENPIRRARCIENAGDTAVIRVNLYRDNVEQTSGEESNISVLCDSYTGVYKLNEVMPRLQTGSTIYVSLVDTKWRCINPFVPVISCDCDSEEL